MLRIRALATPRSRLVWLTVGLAACSGATPRDTRSDGGIDAPPGCGDGVRTGTEQCDGTDLGGATCATAVAPGWVGTLACTSSCELDVAACNTPTTTWTGGFNNGANWGTFDLTALNANAHGFASSVFDGRYMYFVPNAASVIARYDTKGTFTDAGAWTMFDLTMVHAGAAGFQGGAWDGRYLYLAPYDGGVSGVALRFDPQNPSGFASAASWETFDIATVNAAAVGFVRAVFDGRYIYYVPHYNGTAYHGTTARYDTQGDFATASSWQTIDLSTVNASAKGFLGGVYDGRYIYYVPYYNNVTWEGLVMRFDPQASGGFTDKASWTPFDTTTVFGQDLGFYGATFDGRYIYFGQHYDSAATPAATYGVYIARYDTQQPFTSTASWTQYDPGVVAGYDGVVFDGRYVYFSGYYNGTAYSGITACYDTQGGGFTDSAAWSTYDASALNASAKGWDGTGFDGQYIYFVPDYNGTAYQGIVTRFKAKTPGWEPRGWNATFE